LATNEVHISDAGTVVEITIKDEDAAVVDVSLATLKQITLQEPDGTDHVKTAAFTTDGSDGKIQYSVESDVFQSVGNWRIQGKVELVAGTWYTDIERIHVHGNL